MVVFCKRQRKFITPFILALWLFAIVVSVAHACGLDENFGHADLNTSVNVSGHDGLHNGTCSSCDRFCANDFPVLAKLKAVQDPPTGQALLVPVVVDSFQVAASSVPSLLP